MPGFLKLAKGVDKRLAQAEIVERVGEAAAEFIGVAPGRAHQLDFSQASLHAVDDILQDVHEGVLRLSPALIIGAAAYIYEVARLNYGGTYEIWDSDSPVVLLTGPPHFDLCLCAIGRVERRVQIGPSESIPAFFDEYVRLVGVRASAVVR